MQIRTYVPEDAQALMELFHASVHKSCAAEYTPAQLAAWSPDSGLQVEVWQARFASKQPFVATIERSVVGFIELEEDGHIDCLYVRHDTQRRGIASRLLAHAIGMAQARSIRRIHAEVSLTALPFFQARGFTVVKVQRVERNGQWLEQVLMERFLT